MYMHVFPGWKKLCPNQLRHAQFFIPSYSIRQTFRVWILSCYEVRTPCKSKFLNNLLSIVGFYCSYLHILLWFLTSCTAILATCCSSFSASSNGPFNTWFSFTVFFLWLRICSEVFTIQKIGIVVFHCSYLHILLFWYHALPYYLLFFFFFCQKYWWLKFQYVILFHCPLRLV